MEETLGARSILCSGPCDNIINGNCDIISSSFGGGQRGPRQSKGYLGTIAPDEDVVECSESARRCSGGIVGGTIIINIIIINIVVVCVLALVILRGGLGKKCIVIRKR